MGVVKVAVMKALQMVRMVVVVAGAVVVVHNYVERIVAEDVLMLAVIVRMDALDVKPLVKIAVPTTV
jgi:hypothetical protein